MTTGSIQEEDFTLVNIYAPHIGAPIHTKNKTKQTNKKKQPLTDIKGWINENTVTIRDFNTPPVSTDNPSRKKIKKATDILNNTTA